MLSLSTEQVVGLTLGEAVKIKLPTVTRDSCPNNIFHKRSEMLPLKIVFVLRREKKKLYDYFLIKVCGKLDFHRAR